MPDSPQTNSHAQRWTTGLLIGLPALVCVAAAPLWTWWLLVSAIAAVGLWELHGLLFPEPPPLRWKALSFAAGLLLPLGTFVWGPPGLHLALVCSLLAALTLMTLTSPFERPEISRTALFALAWLYVPYLFSFILLLGAAPQGRAQVAFVLAVIVAGDAGAYHTGLKIGRHKLFEKVSPKKTTEGALGGLFFSLLAGTALGTVFFKTLSIPHILGVSFCIAITGQIGDLIESMIKRSCGRKDSSGLLPGHGGVLDRLDSLLFAFPLMWFLLE